MKRIAFLIILLGVCACSPSAPPTPTSSVRAAALSYFDSAGRDDVLSGGSAYSDQPSDPSLWDLPHFVEEVEQVRPALRLPAQPLREMA